MRGALPTPQLRMSLACLPACHPTTPEQSMQASQALRAPPVNTVLQIYLIPRHYSCLNVRRLIGMLFFKVNRAMCRIRSTSYVNFGVTGATEGSLGRIMLTL